ncbi:MAG: AbgT family transporter [Balneolales bacterium]|nr:AbgT family transporter [Balneolales bacterium]
MRFRIKAPNTLILVLLVMVFFAALTWVIPGGQFERVDMDGREVVDPGSFSYIDSNPTSLVDLFLAPVRGFNDSYGLAIIVFIFIVAGAFSIISRTGAFDVFIRRAAKFFSDNPQWRPIYIPFFMVLFSVMGATFGMSEETIVFVPLFVTLSLALGYDSITGVAIPYVGAHIGFAGAVYNPFTVGIAQGLAEIPVFSGAGFRMILWLAITAAGIVMVYAYASSVHKNPMKSPVYNIDKKREIKDEDSEIPPIMMRHIIVILLFFGTLAALIYGVVKLGWYIEELSGLFIGLAVLSALFGRLSGDAAANAFLTGMRDVMGAAVIIALSRAILIIITDAEIVDTILFHLASSLDNLNAYGSASLMLGVQTLLNVVVPSGSGQAALTIPLMAPLGDLIGISRQSVVLIFQLGDGITNMIIPTSGVLMGVLGIAKIPWEVWAKWLFMKLLVLYAIALVFIVVGIAIGYS